MHYFNPGDITALMIAVALLMVLFAIWMIVLLYKAFIVSFHLKGIKAVWGFIAGLLIAETLAIFLNQLIKH